MNLSTYKHVYAGHTAIYRLEFAGTQSGAPQDNTGVIISP